MSAVCLWLFHSDDCVCISILPAQVEFYVDKYQPYDKAGAYAIQEWIGVVGIRSIKGDFYLHRILSGL